MKLESSGCCGNTPIDADSPKEQKKGSSILLSDLGMEKGHTKVNQEHIARVFEQAETVLGNRNRKR